MTANLPFWICSGITLGAGAFACFVPSLRRAILALWIAGLGMGGIYLSLGAELLAIVQWVVATLIAITFTFHAVMFGEYGDVSNNRSAKDWFKQLSLPILTGAAFVAVLGLGASQLRISDIEPAAQPAAGQSVLDLGRILVTDHLLSLEILGMTLLLVAIGAGVVARPDVIREPRDPVDGESP